MKDQIFLGYDPGGQKRFGTAFLRGDKLELNTFSSVDAVVEWTKSLCGSSTPVAAGIDTLLHYSSSDGGWRRVDRELQIKHPEANKSIMSPNSLFGSMAVGGIVLAIRLRQLWPQIALNETHPKVLLHFYGEQYKSNIAPSIALFAKRTGLGFPSKLDEHQLDAAVSAWATREAVSNGWRNLIGGQLENVYPVGEVTYFWPD